jgi:hypothetical protein
MRHPEQRLWDWLRDRLQGQWFAERVENEVKAGTPDLYFSHAKGRGWIEMKVLEDWPRMDSTRIKIPSWTTQQRHWMQGHHTLGGHSWLVVGIERTNEVLILPDVVALRAVDHWTQDELRLQCQTRGLLQEKRKTTAQELLDALSVK